MMTRSRAGHVLEIARISEGEIRSRVHNPFAPFQQAVEAIVNDHAMTSKRETSHYQKLKFMLNIVQHQNRIRDKVRDSGNTAAGCR